MFMQSKQDGANTTVKHAHTHAQFVQRPGLIAIVPIGLLKIIRREIMRVVVAKDCRHSATRFEWLGAPKTLGIDRSSFHLSHVLALNA